MEKEDKKQSSIESKDCQSIAKGTTSSTNPDDGARKRTKKRRRGRGQDPKWHGGGTVFAQAADVSFGYATGQRVELGDSYDGTPRVRRIPGVHIQFLGPNVGRSDDANSAVALGSDKMYLDVRIKKSGTTPYDAVDFGLYMNGASDLYAFIMWAQRLYQTLWMFQWDNEYMPRALIQGQGVNYDSLRENASDFRVGLNNLIAAAAAYPVPNIYPLFDYKVFAYSRYYSEGTSIKDQLYMYAPLWFQQVTTDASGSWELTTLAVNYPVNTVAYNPAGLAYDEVLAIGWKLLQSLRYDSDVIRMSADILALYGEDKLIKLTYVPEFSRAEVHFDISVLEQMKNAMYVMQPGLTNFGFKATQDNSKGYLLFQPAVGYSPTNWTENGNHDWFGNPASDSLKAVGEAIASTWYYRPKMLTTSTYETNNGLVLDSTRLMIAGILSKSTASQTAIDTAVYAAMFGRLVELNPDGSVGMLDYSNNVLVPTTASGAANADVLSALNVIGNLSNFRFHAETEYIYYDAATDKVVESNPVFDVDNMAILDPRDVIRIHRAATLFEMNVEGPAIQR